MTGQLEVWPSVRTGKILASGTYDKTIRLWDVHFYFMFFHNGKPTPLFYAFAEGGEFFLADQTRGFDSIASG